MENERVHGREIGFAIGYDRPDRDVRYHAEELAGAMTQQDPRSYQTTGIVVHQYIRITAEKASVAGRRAITHARLRSYTPRVRS